MKRLLKTSESPLKVKGRYLARYNSIAGFLLILLSGCATVDFDYPKTATSAFIDTSETQLGRQIAETLAEHDGVSGFLPLEDGVDALAMRFALAERAERSIDTQYFLIHNDVVGRAFVEALLRAANRGVRVRLLLDDIHTDGLDPGLAILDVHPNIEVRLFNPFGNRSVKAMNAGSLGRLVRRMHNKSFTVDNQVTIIGGRNICDEYFGAPGAASFGDLDVAGIGPIVNDVSVMFDEYWNHRSALPMPALTKMPEEPEQALADLQSALAQSRTEIGTSKYAAAVRSSIYETLHGDKRAITFAPYSLVYDSPDKSLPGADESAASIAASLRDSITDVEQELLIITPYLVLRNQELQGFQDLRDRDIDITVLTNSLAANNHTISHSGYKPARKSLLKMGVKIYETRADARLAGDEGIDRDAAKTTLHAKAFVVDQRRLFIGSFNWNQRSKNLDTEMGVIIESSELATAFAERLHAIDLEKTYEVYLNENGRLRWKGVENGQQVILSKEPQTSWWHRFTASFLSILPIKSQL
ncbi:MAG: phospholipase D family protein [Woeseiaceae bacterium]